MSRPAPSRPTLSRRAFTGGMAAVMLAAVTACGDDGSAATDVSASSSSPASFPVDVTHAYGTTTITAEPKRIAVVGLVEQDALLALGVVPVATTEWFGKQPGAVFPWAEAALGSSAVPTVLTNTDGIQFEKVAAQKPDLILGIYSGMTKEDYATLSKIAPTIAQPPGQSPYAASWEDVTLTVGKAVGKPEKAQELVDETNAKFAAVVAANPSFKGRTGIVATVYEGYFVYGPEDSRGRLMTSLGFTLPTGLGTVVGSEFGGSLSKERTDLLDTGVLVWLVTDYTKDQAAVKANPLYAALDVTRQGRDVFLEDGEPLGAATSFITVLSLPYLLEGLVPQLAAAADGDPATKVQRAADAG